MTGLSIQLNRFGVGASRLDAPELYPVHKKSIEECVAKIFERALLSVSDKEIPLRIRLNEGRAVLYAGGKEIPLEKSRELKRLNRIVRYYQHTGHLERAPLDQREEVLRAEESKKAVSEINQASIPGTNGHILAGMRLADDTLALTRNIMYSIPRMGPKDPVANHLGYYAGIFWTFFALRELDDGLIEYKRSKTIGDSEGTRRAESRVLSGAIISGGSLAYLGGKVSDTFLSLSVGSVLMTAANYLFGAGSLLSMGASILGATRCDRFNSRLNEYLDNRALTEEERMKGAVQFLKESISVTPEERSALIKEITEAHPDWSKEQRNLLLQQKLADLTEVKVKYMKRRTSNKSLKLILDQSDQILSKLNDPQKSLEGIRDATILINTVLKESKIKKSLYLLGVLASIISFAAMAVMAFMSLGVFPFVLYGISATIYLAITVYSIAGSIQKQNDRKLLQISNTQISS